MKISINKSELTYAFNSENTNSTDLIFDFQEFLSKGSEAGLLSFKVKSNKIDIKIHKDFIESNIKTFIPQLNKMLEIYLNLNSETEWKIKERSSHELIEMKDKSLVKFYDLVLTKKNTCRYLRPSTVADIIQNYLTYSTSPDEIDISLNLSEGISKSILQFYKII